MDWAQRLYAAADGEAEADRAVSRALEEAADIEARKLGMSFEESSDNDDGSVASGSELGMDEALSVAAARQLFASGRGWKTTRALAVRTGSESIRETVVRRVAGFPFVVDDLLLRALNGVRGAVVVPGMGRASFVHFWDSDRLVGLSVCLFWYVFVAYFQLMSYRSQHPAHEADKVTHEHPLMKALAKNAGAAWVRFMSDAIEIRPATVSGNRGLSSLFRSSFLRYGPYVLAEAVFLSFAPAFGGETTPSVVFDARLRNVTWRLIPELLMGVRITRPLVSEMQVKLFPHSHAKAPASLARTVSHSRSQTRSPRLAAELKSAPSSPRLMACATGPLEPKPVADNRKVPASIVRTAHSLAAFIALGCATVVAAQAARGRNSAPRSVSRAKHGQDRGPRQLAGTRPSKTGAPKASTWETLWALHPASSDDSSWADASSNETVSHSGSMSPSPPWTPVNGAFPDDAISTASTEASDNDGKPWHDPELLGAGNRPTVLDELGFDYKGVMDKMHEMYGRAANELAHGEAMLEVARLASSTELQPSPQAHPPSPPSTTRTFLTGTPGRTPRRTTALASQRSTVALVTQMESHSTLFSAPTISMAMSPSTASAGGLTSRSGWSDALDETTAVSSLGEAVGGARPSTAGLVPRGVIMGPSGVQYVIGDEEALLLDEMGVHRGIDDLTNASLASGIERTPLPRHRMRDLARVSQPSREQRLEFPAYKVTPGMETAAEAVGEVFLPGRRTPLIRRTIEAEPVVLDPFAVRGHGAAVRFSVELASRSATLDAGYYSKQVDELSLRYDAAAEAFAAADSAADRSLLHLRVASSQHLALAEAEAEAVLSEKNARKREAALAEAASLSRATRVSRAVVAAEHDQLVKELAVASGVGDNSEPSDGGRGLRQQRATRASLRALRSRLALERVAAVDDAVRTSDNPLGVVVGEIDTTVDLLVGSMATEVERATTIKSKAEAFARTTRPASVPEGVAERVYV
ncbi:uncharacterized protein AMSG_01572 [Thecamonas trahens ATCC 50062]|uniref:Uncharacterized protein n=1 Tax=Thecamonas trahens ATCC 50062 TaxID=461836 RepID=A0A0L0DR14_THETB|nr:hypothetical protein AMSG_01572 [Thecamonas trahens ATCC 50062]KNC54722.1 hypothetical protein AMSG_01572 [Thecamonas trahens ATCC 50062]|eukprot:XP_013761622.1 hypothetical protein AMSG_01572 [Thecamonas trahens ATCC 50062]